MDRDQFFSILKSLFHPHLFISSTDAVYSLINRNEDALQELQDKIITQEKKLFTWLGKFDEAASDEERQKIVNTVSMEVEIDQRLVDLANPNKKKVY